MWPLCSFVPRCCGICHFCGFRFGFVGFLTMHVACNTSNITKRVSMSAVWQNIVGVAENYFFYCCLLLVKMALKLPHAAAKALRPLAVTTANRHWALMAHCTLHQHQLWRIFLPLFLLLLSGICYCALLGVVVGVGVASSIKKSALPGWLKCVIRRYFSIFIRFYERSHIHA